MTLVPSDARGPIAHDEGARIVGNRGDERAPSRHQVTLAMLRGPAA